MQKGREDYVSESCDFPKKESDYIIYLIFWGSTIAFLGNLMGHQITKKGRKPGHVTCQRGNYRSCDFPKRVFLMDYVIGHVTLQK